MPDLLDDRGEIRNIKNIAIIFSAKGSVRSNHYHRAGGHYLEVKHGHMVYRSRPVGGGQEIVVDVGPGGIIFTGPNTEHRTEFLEDTLMVSYALISEADYAADTVHVEW